MNEKIFKTILWKENIIFLKSCFPVCVLYYAIELYFYINNQKNNLSLNDGFLATQIFSFVAINIAVIGCLISSLNMGIDIKAKIMPILLGMTKKKEIIWLAKVVYSFIVGLISSLVGSGLIIYSYTTQRTIEGNIACYFEYILAGSLVGLAFVTINMLFTWIIKYEVIILIISLILPVALIMLLIFLIDLIQKISLTIIGILALVSLLFVVGSFFIIVKLPNSLFVEKV
ncbi:MAG: hypothetical protein IKS48_12080 [Eubacterium sp.]|nr:hypothetical protein [Eubacterium sp.]